MEGKLFDMFVLTVGLEWENKQVKKWQTKRRHS